MENNNNLIKTKTFKWYILSCKGGKEEQVKNDIFLKVAKLNYSDHINEIKIIKNNFFSTKQKKQIKKNIFVGYIFINMKVSTEILFIIRNVKNVKGFIGSNSINQIPTALTQNDVKQFIEQNNINEKSKNDEVNMLHNIKIGEYVQILTGPFKDVEGKVSALYPKTNKIKVEIYFFNRTTELEIDYKNCKKLNL